MGCHRRLATFIGCDYARLSSNLTDLASWGYIERSVHPLNKRLRVYKVLYTPEDAAVMKGITPGNSSPNGKQSSPDSLPDSKASRPDSLPTGDNSGRNSLPTRKGFSNASMTYTRKYMPLKGRRYFAEARKEIR